MPGAGSELPEELALGAPVAFAKGVNGVDLAQVEASALGECVHCEASQMSFRLQLAQHIFESRLNELKRSKRRTAGLRYAHDAKFPCPGKDIAK